MGMEKKMRLISLDGLKGIFSITIILIHYTSNAINKFGVTTDQLPFYKFMKVFYDQGYVFIFPFFWISGFLIAMQYKNSLKQMSLGVFIKRRLRKLYPMVFASITIGLVMSIADKYLTGSKVTTPFDFWLLIKDYSLTYSGWAEPVDLIGYVGGVEWFICVLLLCYIYYYFIVHKIRQENYLLAISVMFFAGWAVYAWPLGPMPFFGGKGGYCAFFGGTLLYEFVYGDLKDVFKSNLNDKTKSVLSAIAILILALLGIKGYLSMMSVLVFVCPLMIIFSLEIRWVKTVLEFKPIQLLGMLSMSIYMSHALTLRASVMIIKSLSLNCTFCDLPVFFIVITGCFVFALIYYLLVEKKFVAFFNKSIGTIFPYFAE